MKGQRQRRRRPSRHRTGSHMPLLPPTLNGKTCSGRLPARQSLPSSPSPRALPPCAAGRGANTGTGRRNRQRQGARNAAGTGRQAGEREICRIRKGSLRQGSGRQYAGNHTGRKGRGSRTSPSSCMVSLLRCSLRAGCALWLIRGCRTSSRRRPRHPR